MRKALAILATVLIMALIGLIWIPIPFPLRKTITAYELKHDDPAYGMAREISIDGTYCFYLYRADEFRGSFEIEGYEKTVGHEVLPILVSKDHNAPMCYLTDDFMLNSLFSINSDFLMRRMFICVMVDNGWSGADGISIVAPATTLDEAKAVWLGLSRGNEWLSAITWPDK